MRYASSAALPSGLSWSGWDGHPVMMMRPDRVACSRVCIGVYCVMNPMARGCSKIKECEAREEARGQR
eukprot:1648556-Rhodomonas_salina.1